MPEEKGSPVKRRVHLYRKQHEFSLALFTGTLRREPCIFAVKKENLTANILKLVGSAGLLFCRDMVIYRHL